MFASWAFKLDVQRLLPVDWCDSCQDSEWSKKPIKSSCQRVDIHICCTLDIITRQSMFATTCRSKYNVGTVAQCYQCSYNRSYWFLRSSPDRTELAPYPCRTSLKFPYDGKGIQGKRDNNQQYEKYAQHRPDRDFTPGRSVVSNAIHNKNNNGEGKEKDGPHQQRRW